MLTLRSNMSLVSSEMPPESGTKKKLQETGSKTSEIDQLTNHSNIFYLLQTDGSLICTLDVRT